MGLELIYAVFLVIVENVPTKGYEIIQNYKRQRMVYEQMMRKGEDLCNLTLYSNKTVAILATGDKVRLRLGLGLHLCAVTPTSRISGKSCRSRPTAQRSLERPHSNCRSKTLRA